MARVPGVPGLDPVNQPNASPGEFGSGGEAIAKAGDNLQDITLQQQGFDLYMKRAQEHVDTLAARNQLDSAFVDLQNQLSKTPNSRDVPDVIEQGNKTLNDISARWSNSPAAVDIQMDADALRPSMSRIGTVRQVDLMGKELKINLNTQGERLAGEYAAGNRTAAVAAFGTAVAGGVNTGLLGDVEAQEYMRQFKQSGQELQIKNDITNADPSVNQRIYDQINQHRDQFPDVTQEQLDTYKGQALSAFEAHTKMKDWADGQVALQQQLVPKINQFTNPATGHFDEGAALTDNADRFKDGEITETQSKVLAQGFSSHQAQLEVGLKTEANKRLDDIEKKLSVHDFSGASADLEANQPWFENNGFGDDYRAALRYTAQKMTEVRSEAAAGRAEQRYEYQYKREVAANQSSDQLGNVQHFIVGGGVLTKADIYNMTGTGPNKMSTVDADRAWKTMDAYEKEPDFKSALDYIDGSFKIPKGASPDLAASQNQRYADTVNLFQQQVNANPNKSKLEIAHDIVKSSDEEKIKAHADALFGNSPTTRLGKLFSSFADAADRQMFGASSAPKTPTAPVGPPRPANVPEGYIFNATGPKGDGWYAAPK